MNNDLRQILYGLLNVVDDNTIQDLIMKFNFSSEDRDNILEEINNNAILLSQILNFFDVDDIKLIMDDLKFPFDHDLDKETLIKVLTVVPDSKKSKPPLNITKETGQKAPEENVKKISQPKNYTSMTVNDLKELARKRNIYIKSNLLKKDIINLIKQNDIKEPSAVLENLPKKIPQKNVKSRDLSPKTLLSKGINLLVYNEYVLPKYSNVIQTVEALKQTNLRENLMHKLNFSLL